MTGNTVLFIIDKKMPDEAKERLASEGKILELETSGITYEAISGHPDIYILSPSSPIQLKTQDSCLAGRQAKLNTNLIISPSLPAKYLKILSGYRIPFELGETAVGDKYPESSHYNAVLTDRYLIHNFRYTDPMISRTFDDLDMIHVSQGYTRCNLLPLRDDNFITSDEGIARILRRYGLKVLLVNPKDIGLPGFRHGFFGGACGVHEDNVYICGTLDHFQEKKKVRSFLSSLGYRIRELYDGPLVDVGSILVIR